jgi:TIR domain
MSYSHDIFISYRRHTETLSWIREHFFPLLEHRVGLQLGWDPNVYVHEVTDQIPAGAMWPVELGAQLAGSRILVALWTRNYFNSRWCTEELCHMLAREKEADCRSVTNKFGLVVPVVIHDGEDFPAGLGEVQRLEIQPFYNTRMRRDSELAAQLSNELDLHAAGLADAIRHAPEWRSEWPEETAEQLLEEFYRPEPATQDRLPRYYGR